MTVLELRSTAYVLHRGAQHLTDEWKRAGLEERQQFASLTDIIYRGWSCLSVVSPMNAKQIAQTDVPHIAADTDSEEQ